MISQQIVQVFAILFFPFKKNTLSLTDKCPNFGQGVRTEGTLLYTVYCVGCGERGQGIARHG